MRSDDHALYANHRRFMEAQRGVLSRHAGFDVVHGDIPAFQIAMLHEAAAADQVKGHTLYVFVPPWADPGAESFGVLAYQLTHMSLPREALAAPAPRSELTVGRVRDEEELRAFTATQAAGYAENADAYDGLFGWMWDKNARALPQQDQAYYCLRQDGAVVSVLLTVDTGDALGIYAVATLPALRKRGLSSYLLRAVCADAPEHQQVCLQVMRGSDAERLYAKLGFVERFVVDVYESGAPR